MTKSSKLTPNMQQELLHLVDLAPAVPNVGHIARAALKKRGLIDNDWTWVEASKCWKQLPSEAGWAEIEKVTGQKHNQGKGE